MAQTADKLQSESQLKTLNDALGSGGFLQIRRMLNGLPPADAAHLIESTPHKIRSVLWQLIDSENEGDINTSMTKSKANSYGKWTPKKSRPSPKVSKPTTSLTSSSNYQTA
jgi:hypothetical protein